MPRLVPRPAVCALLALSLLPATYGCGSEPEPAPAPPPKPVNVVVIDESQWVDDGARLAWDLKPGRYRVRMIASGDGATLEWVGCECQGTPQATTSYKSLCEVEDAAQLIVTNPTTFGSGPAVRVTLKVTKLGV